MKKLAALIVILSCLVAPTSTVEAIIPDPPAATIVQDTRGDMYVPEVMGDPYYRAGDVFQVTKDGYLYMIGTGGMVREDVDWFVMQGTFPTGHYVLDDSGALVPVQEWEVSARTITA